MEYLLPQSRGHNSQTHRAMCEIWIQRLPDLTKGSQYRFQISTFPLSTTRRRSSLVEFEVSKPLFLPREFVVLYHPGFGRVVDLFTSISWLSSHHLKQHSRAPDLGLLFFVLAISSPLAPSKSLHLQQESFGLVHSCKSSLEYTSTTCIRPYYLSLKFLSYDNHPPTSALQSHHTYLIFFQ
jgi:hypothetical protein